MSDIPETTESKLERIEIELRKAESARAGQKRRLRRRLSAKIQRLSTTIAADHGFTPVEMDAVSRALEIVAALVDGDRFDEEEG